MGGESSAKKDEASSGKNRRLQGKRDTPHLTTREWKGGERGRHRANAELIKRREPLAVGVLTGLAGSLRTSTKEVPVFGKWRESAGPGRGGAVSIIICRCRKVKAAMEGKTRFKVG